MKIKYVTKNRYLLSWLSFHVKKAQVLYICCSKTLCAMCSVLKFQSYVFVVLNHSDNMSSDSYSNLWFLSNLMIINIYFLLHIWFSCKLLIWTISRTRSIPPIKEAEAHSYYTSTGLRIPQGNCVSMLLFALILL
jgi:hypothetical protein